MKKPTNQTVKKFVISSAFVAGTMLVAPNVSDAALGDQTLKEGMWHEDVKELQDVLKQKGYFTYPTSTGFFGPITKEALIEFQRDASIQTSGIADGNTFKALRINGSQQSVKTTAKTSTSNTLSTNQLLRKGSRGKQVSILQEMLKAKGYYTYNVDGIYGNLTEQAVRRYQKANGLAIDGLAGKNTLTSLVKNGSAKVTKPADTPTDKQTNENNNKAKDTVQSTTLRKGTSGQAVTKLQNDLKQLGFFSVNATGYYGDITVNSVRDFQRKHGLVVDGIAGPKTFSKLSQVLKGKNDTVLEDPSFNVMNVIADASELIGVPYTWGGNSPQQGFDCSGFLVYLFNKQGIQLPRTVAQIWNVGKTVSTPQVGDLVFFETYQPGPSHVGIYIGNNKFVQAGTSTGVTTSNMNSSYWGPKYLGAKRIH